MPIKSKFFHKKAIAGFMVIFVIPVIWILIYQSQKPSLKVTIITPPLAYTGKDQAREVGKKIPQINTRIALTESNNTKESRHWITQKFAQRYDISDRTPSTSETLKRYPEGVVYAVIDIRKKGRCYALVIDGGNPPDLSFFTKVQNKPVMTYIYDHGRWLAAGADEIECRELLHAINSTTLDSLEKDLSARDLNALLKEF
jgi:hypothetical protein